VISHAYLVTPRVIDLQRVTMEAQLLGFTGLAKGGQRLLIQETLRVWADSKGPAGPASPEPRERTCQAGSL
jgi:hypothetical protein